jgi:hypothetical protein
MASNLGLENECGNHRVQRGSSIRIGASNPGVQRLDKKVTSGNTAVKRTERVAAEDLHLKDNPTEWKESQRRRTSGQVGGK